MYGGYTPSWKANGDITVATFVVLDASTPAPFSVVQAGSNGKVIGVSTDGTKYPPGLGYSSTKAAEAGDEVLVYVEGMICQLFIGSGGCTVGDYLISDSSGNGVTLALGSGHTTLQYCGAIALETASSGEKAFVQVRCMPFIPSVS